MRKSKSLYKYIMSNSELKYLLDEWVGKDINNNDIDINSISRASGKKVLWKCKQCNGIWETTVHNRTTHFSGCPYCSKKWQGESIRYGHIKSTGNTLYNWCENNGVLGERIKQEWLGIDNDGNVVSINRVNYTTRKKFKFKCLKCGKTWFAGLYNRTVNKTGCPYCYGSAINIGVNDLHTWADNNGVIGKNILNEFVGIDTNNNIVQAQNIHHSSHLIVRWKCTDCGNVWETSINNRVMHLSGCPHCKKSYQTSYPEQFLYMCLKQVFAQAINRYKAPIKYNNQQIEFDIAIPLKNKAVCIEYGATYFHSNRAEIDDIKRHICSKYNIDYIEIIESSYNEFDDNFSDLDKNICHKVVTISRTNTLEQKQEKLEIIAHKIIKSLYGGKYNINIEKAKTDAMNVMHNK